MKFSNLLHKTPWWLLIGSGFLLLALLAIFVTPFHLIKLEKSGVTPAENRAIKREIDYAFSEGAIDIASGVVKEMMKHTKDPERRAELQSALAEIDDARRTLREAGKEVVRAKRDAAATVSEAVREATRTIAEAQASAARGLREAGVDNEKVNKALEEAMQAAREAEEEAQREAAARSEKRVEEAQKRADEARQRLADARKKIDDKKRIVLGKHGGAPAIQIDLSGTPGPGELAELPPEQRAEIRRKVSRDVRKIGVGAGLILLFIPIFILTVIAKFYIDRTRASQRVADLKLKEAEYSRMSQQVTEAKLQALQAQVEPHFLYNTLASVQALTEVDPARANAMTGHLIQYLRNALPKMRESVSTIAQEMELVRSYLAILQMRMGDRLSFEIDVPPELASAPFPPLMVPSLVENAIKHGLEPLREGGKITIRAEAVAGSLRIIVADTGRGFSDKPGAGVGLANIRERLEGLYGDKGKLTLEANQPKGVVATLEVPRDGARVASAGAAEAAAAQKAEAERSAAAKTLAAMGAAERMWRKGLSFAFIALVIVAAVVCGLAIVGVITGIVPLHFADESLGGAPGALVGTVAILAAFALIVLAIAIVIAITYGLGFLIVGLLVFIPVVIIVGLVPALAPFILVGLLVWWLIRRSKRKAAAASAAAAELPATTGIESGHADGHPR